MSLKILKKCKALMYAFVYWSIVLVYSPRQMRYIGRWLRSILSSKGIFSLPAPLFPFSVIDVVDEYIDRSKIVFEYGSGASTIWFARRANKVVSIEHDEKWYLRLLDALQRERIQNCRLLFCPPEPSEGTSGENRDPRSYASLWYPNMSFKQYVTSIDGYPDGYFDLILIDGRSRPSCILHAIPKLRSGGMLILDDSEREYYYRARRLLAKWQKRRHFGPVPKRFYFGCSTIYMKPALGVKDRDSHKQQSDQEAPE